MNRNQSFRFSVPKQTNQFFPLRQEVVLFLPIVESISVKIPPGHKDAAQMLITTPGMVLMDDIHGDGQSKESGRLDVLIFGPPYYITFVGWNNSVFLDHEFTIEVTTRDV
jgi:hypothetical protein